MTGLIGVGSGPDAAFRWTLYILLALWPISVYLCARWLGASRCAAAASAAMAPFLMGVTGVGYEQKAYLWIGYGVWTQLWASLTLPLAWGLGWRAVREGRGFFLAAFTASLTTALHFETGYLAILPLIVWPFVAGRPVMLRLRRAAIVVGGALLASAWVIVPLIEQRAWASTNEVLRGTALANGYGASRVLRWLVSGQLLDAGRIPVITVLAGIGVLVACRRWRSDPHSRALVVVFAACLLVSFGRATFGSLVNLIPGSSDIFFRRFMMGIQLAGLLLAGIGAAWCAQAVWKRLERWRLLRGVRLGTTPARLLPTALAIGAIVLVLAPAWTQASSLDARNAEAIKAQRLADAAQGAEVNRLVAIIRQDGGGRVYAGMPSNWGMQFTVGAVPVFKYLESRDVDEVGYTLRTASLMTNPEYFFDERNPSDYSLFGIHYLILPTQRLPPVPALLVTRAGPYALWRTGSRGYLRVGTVIGSVAADRTNLGARSIALLRSPLAERHAYLDVIFGRGGRAAGHLPTVRRGPEVGTVAVEHDDLVHGEVFATITMRRPGVVVLSASFDPGWTATIDGHARPVQMVAPALVGARVPAGVHRVLFRYVGLSDYAWLFALSAVALAALLVADALRRRQTRRPFPYRDRAKPTRPATSRSTDALPEDSAI